MHLMWNREKRVKSRQVALQTVFLLFWLMAACCCSLWWLLFLRLLLFFFLHIRISNPYFEVLFNMSTIHKLINIPSQCQWCRSVVLSRSLSPHVSYTATRQLKEKKKIKCLNGNQADNVFLFMQSYLLLLGDERVARVPELICGWWWWGDVEDENSMWKGGQRWEGGSSSVIELKRHHLHDHETTQDELMKFIEMGKSLNPCIGSGNSMAKTGNRRTPYTHTCSGQSICECVPTELKRGKMNLAFCS